MKIKLKAMCIFQNDGKLLASKLYDRVKNQTFYRLLGGHIEFQETAEQAVRREIIEEINSEIENLKLIGIIENIFTYLGKPGHEIDYLYIGTLRRGELYKQNQIQVHEDAEFDTAEWISVQDVTNGLLALYPPFDYKSIFQDTQ